VEAIDHNWAVKKFTCKLCASRCEMMVFVEDGTVNKVVGNPWACSQGKMEAYEINRDN
jgi:anaerobic selenocysteine-containing dehydrogenase